MIVSRRRASAPPIALLAIDVDGTLVRGDDVVTARTRTALRRAVDAGLALVLATGRRYRTTRRVLAALDLRLPVICLGGALSKGASGETLQARPLAAEAVRELQARARRDGVALVFQYDAGPREPDFVVDAACAWNAATRRYVELGGAHCQASDAPAGVAGGGVLAVGCFGPEQALAAFQNGFAELREAVVESVLVRSQKTPDWYLEITAPGVNKWTALRCLAAEAGIVEAAVCAVGDAGNDLPMIRAAGLGVAVANATPRLKAAAVWITGANHEDGVATLVETLLEERARHRRGAHGR